MKELGIAGKLAKAFIQSKLTPLIVAASVLLGIGAVVMLPREEEPQIIVPMVDVMVQMPGASSEEVEERRHQAGRKAPVGNTRRRIHLLDIIARSVDRHRPVQGRPKRRRRHRPAQPKTFSKRDQIPHGGYGTDRQTAFDRRCADPCSDAIECKLRPFHTPAGRGTGQRPDQRGQRMSPMSRSSAASGGRSAFLLDDAKMSSRGNCSRSHHPDAAASRTSSRRREISHRKTARSMSRPAIFWRRRMMSAAWSSVFLATGRSFCGMSRRVVDGPEEPADYVMYGARVRTASSPP